MKTLILVCSINLAPSECTEANAFDTIWLERSSLLCGAESVLSGQVKVHGDQEAYYKVRCEGRK